jgi:parallel beta-helix repeat protein
MEFKMLGKKGRTVHRTILFFLLFLLIGVGGVLGAECNAGGEVTEDCLISGSMTLSGKTYYLNDTNGNGVMRFNCDNCVVDGNGTTLIGNKTSGSKAISRSYIRKKNVTIKNLTIEGYATGVYVINVTNFTIENVTFHDIVSYGVFFDDLVNDSLVIDCTINNTLRAFALDRVNTTTFENNQIINYTQYGASFEGSSNNIFRGNTYNTTSSSASYGIYSTDDGGGTIFSENNTFVNEVYYGNNVVEKGYYSDKKSFGTNFTNVSYYSFSQNAIMVNIGANLTIDTVYVNDSINDGIYINQTNPDYSEGRNTIVNTTIYNIPTVSDSGIYIYYDKGYNTISDNYCYNCSIGITVENSTDNEISYNAFDGEMVVAQDNRGIRNLHSNNTMILHNSANNSDIGITVEGGDNVYIYNNTITNSTFGNDWYNLGIRVSAYSSNASILNNTINGTGTGIFLRRAYDFTIDGNDIILDNSLQGDSWEPQSCISALELSKSFLGSEGDFNENSNPSAIATMNSTFVGTYRSENGTIENNNCNNSNIFLRLQGAVNVSHDFSDYWYYRYRIPTHLVETDEYFIRSNSSNITTRLSDGTDTLRFRQGYYNYRMLEMNLTRNYFSILSLNDTVTYNISVYNLTNALIYYGNNTLIGEGNISENDDNINITFPPNNYTYVLDDFNLTEGFYRTNQPVNYSSVDSAPLVNKYIVSNLTDTINVTSYLDTYSCHLSEVTVFNSSNSSHVYKTYNSSFDCTDNTLTLLDLPIYEGGVNMTLLYSHVGGGGGGSYGDTPLVPEEDLTPIEQIVEDIQDVLSDPASLLDTSNSTDDGSKGILSDIYKPYLFVFIIIILVLVFVGANKKVKK